MERKPKIIELLQRAQQEEQALVAALTEAERTKDGTVQAWSPKDLVAHLAAWKQHMADSLAAAGRDDTIPEYEDIDQENAQIFAAHRHLSWDEIQARSEQAQAALAAAVQMLSEGELTDPQRSSRRGGQPLWRAIVGNGFTHPMMHMAQFFAECGEKARALAMSELVAGQVSALDPSPAWQGVTLYNLACTYALIGEKKKAIVNLGQALRLNPDLVGWSKQDPDFNAIRDMPGYAALYAA